jgi:bifunctional oligoribonuclease and PAP phosphatase NrnA
MALNATQQAQELITRATRILVVTRDRAPVDALAAGVACGLFLKKLGKQADVVVPGFDAKSGPTYLRGANDVRGTVGAMRSFHVTLDVSKVSLSELMYDVKDGKLEITVVPKEKEWHPNDVSFKHGEDRYDLVIALDCPDMLSLGPVAREHADFLYRTHIINIDCGSTNEHWGQVNLVDMNAVATTEVLFNLFETWNRNLIDEDMATAFLTGMIAKTKSFRTPNVTPKTLATSSQLIAMGARREEIVNGLWRTRSVATLKLWGHALARLNQDRDIGLVWSVLSHESFLKAGASPDQLEDVIDELIGYAPEAKVFALIYESEPGKGICVTIAAQPPRSAAELGRTFGASGTRDRASVCMTNVSLIDASKTVIDRLREAMKATGV